MLTNKRIKEIKELQNKRGTRRKAGIFIIEGSRLYMEAPTESLQQVYVTEELIKKANKSLLARLKETGYETVSSEQLKKMSDTETPQGILALANIPHYNLGDILAEDGKVTLIVLEDIQDPGNLGTIFRTAEAAGIKGIIMTADTVDLFNPKVVRSTMGAIFRVPFVYTDAVDETLDMLKSKGIRLYAGSPGGRDIREIKPAERRAFLIGNEGNGLKKSTCDRADTAIKIPMEGRAESLNAAVAAALFMYMGRF